MDKKIIKYRWWIIGVSVLFTLGFSTLLLKLEIDPDLKNYFPKTMTSMVNTDRIEDIFGNQDLIIIDDLGLRPGCDPAQEQSREAQGPILDSPWHLDHCSPPWHPWHFLHLFCRQQVYL